MSGAASSLALRPHGYYVCTRLVLKAQEALARDPVASCLVLAFQSIYSSTWHLARQGECHLSTRDRSPKDASAADSPISTSGTVTTSLLRQSFDRTRIVVGRCPSRNSRSFEGGQRVRQKVLCLHVSTMHPKRLKPCLCGPGSYPVPPHFNASPSSRLTLCRGRRCRILGPSGPGLFSIEAEVNGSGLVGYLFLSSGCR